MRIFLTVLAVLFFLISCDDGKKTLPKDDDVISVSDTDFESDADDQEIEDETIDDITVPDEDIVVVERSPEGIAVSSGHGAVSSKNYKMELNVGKPLTGQLMQSTNYKLEILIK
jgi:hypothetical protein